MRRWLPDLVLLAAPLALTWAACGGLGAYPTDDDYMFARTVQRWLADGRLEWRTLDTQLPVGATQIVAGAAACKVSGGFSFRALHAASCLALWIGAAGFCLALRGAGVARGAALAAALAAVAAPVWFQQAFSFMSDGFAAALRRAAGAALAAGFVQQSPAWLCAGGLAGLLAVLNRQTAAGLAAAPPIAAVGWAWSQRRCDRTTVLLLLFGVGLPGMGLAMQEAGAFGAGNRARAATISTVDGGAENRTRLITAYSACLFLGLHTLPLAPWLWRRPRGGLAWCGALAGAAPLLAFLVRPSATLDQAGGPSLQNARWGPVLLADAFLPSGASDTRWPAAVWQGITLLAAVQFAALGAEAGRTLAMLRTATRHGWARAGLLGAAGFTAAVQWGFLACHFDRYWLAPLALVLGWLALGLTTPAAGRVWASLGLSAVLLVVDVAFTHDYLDRNRARWTLVAAAEADGFGPEEIDAGYEHWGWSRSARGLVRWPPWTDRSRPWWTSGAARRFVAAAPFGGMVEVRRAEWSSWVAGAPRVLLLLRPPAVP